MKKNLAILISAVIIVSGLAGALYYLDTSHNPHLGVISQHTLSGVIGTDSIYYTNITNSTSVPGFILPGNAISMFGTSFEVTQGPYFGNLILLSYHFNSKLHAEQYYNNRSSYFGNSGTFYNDTYKGFTFTWYGNVTGNLANHVFFYAVGYDGSYAFLITSLTEMNSNMTNVSNLIHDQIDSMT